MLEKLPDSVGRALSDQRAGLENIVYHRVPIAAQNPISVDSLAFAPYGRIPALYTADGEGISPPLRWGNVPAHTAQIVLLVEDADAPTPHPLVHAIVLNLEGSDGAIAEGALPSPDHAGEGFEMGLNSYLQQTWLAPDPPPAHGVHRYAFQVFALSQGAVLDAGIGRDALVEAIRATAIASGCLIGTYQRDAALHDEPLAPQESLTGLT